MQGYSGQRVKSKLLYFSVYSVSQRAKNIFLSLRPLPLSVQNLLSSLVSPCPSACKKSSFSHTIPHLKYYFTVSSIIIHQTAINK
jgi:hypothetical protein